MKLNVKNTDGSKKGTIELPDQFKEGVRRDLIKRAVLAKQANNRQPYGAKPRAGKRHSAYLSKKRREYRGTYGIGQSRTPRKVMSSQGTRFNWVGAVVPGTVGGRRAHPPKAQKDWSQKINDKERRKAIRSALTATTDTEHAEQRGHKVPDDYPFILSDDIQTLKKTRDAHEALLNLGFEDELLRTKEKTVRSGKGKRRGRKYKRKTGPLIVVSEQCTLQRAARNIPGVEVVTAEQLNAELLAPGTHPGRVTLFTESAIETLNERELFR